MRKKLLTDSVLAQIPGWIWDEGLSPVDIARKIGCTVGTLRVQCSHHHLSLRGASNSRAPRNVDLQRNTQMSYRPPAELRLNLTDEIRARLRERAALAGLSELALVTALIEAIDRDDLYNAVLDDAR